MCHVSVVWTIHMVRTIASKWTTKKKVLWESMHLIVFMEHFLCVFQVLTSHYERCGRYYGSGGGYQGSASEEEKRLTMMLFSGIFDSLAQRVCISSVFRTFSVRRTLAEEIMWWILAHKDKRIMKSYVNKLNAHRRNKEREGKT